jgi:hypothetical protein
MKDFALESAFGARIDRLMAEGITLKDAIDRAVSVVQTSAQARLKAAGACPVCGVVHSPNGHQGGKRER